MKRRVLPLACAAIFFTAALTNGQAETPLELLDKTQKDLQTYLDTAKKEAEAKVAATAKEAVKPEPGKDEEGAVEARLLARMGIDARPDFVLQGASQILQQLHQALVAGRQGEALQNLQQIGVNLSLPEDVRKDVDALTKAINREQTDREEAYAKAVDAACQRASEVLPKATEPRELDAPLRELTQLAAQPPGRDYYNGGNDSRSSNKLQAAVQFVNHWQDYLLARSRNNEEAQAQALRNLSESSNYNQMMLVPRSEILARIPPKESPNNNQPRLAGRPARPQAQIDADAIDLVQGIKKLDEIPGALAKLVELRRETTSQPSYNFRSDSDLGVALTALQGFERTRLEIQNGLATNISLGANRGSDYNVHPEIENVLLPLRVQLIKLAAPRLLGAAESEKPTADEGLDAYLRRLIEAAKKRQDWTAVARGLDLKQTLATTTSGPFTVTNSQEAEAFKNFFAGRNLETAGQYEQAVVSYLTALRSGQEDLPAVAIGERLAAIEKARPAEYASGKEAVLNPPRSPYGDPRAGYPGMGAPRTFDPRYPGGRPGLPGQPPAEEKLAVPAASPTPAASPASPVPATTPAKSISP